MTFKAFEVKVRASLCNGAMPCFEVELLSMDNRQMTDLFCRLWEYLGDEPLEAEGYGRIDPKKEKK